MNHIALHKPERVYIHHIQVWRTYMGIQKIIDEFPLFHSIPSPMPLAVAAAGELIEVHLLTLVESMVSTDLLELLHRHPEPARAIGIHRRPVLTSS